MAEVVIRAELAQAGLADRVRVESAGTGDWHLGEPMDSGAVTELTRRGFDGSAHRARQIGRDWLDRYDLLIATDHGNLRRLQQMAAGQPGVERRIRLLRSFDPEAPSGADVPDPYGGPPRQFAEVFDMVKAAATGLVAGVAKVLADAGGG